MNKAKRLGLCFTLVAVLSTAVFAGETPSPPYVCGETETPPCACAPGETAAPPCTAQSVNDDPVIPGETLAPPAQPVVDVTDITEAVLWALSLF